MSVPDDQYERIENRLMSHGIYVTALDRDEAAVEITYETVHATDGVPHRDIGRVVNVLRDFREEGWEPVDVRGVVTDLDGEQLGSWHAEAEWFHELAAGEITETEFSGRVLDTIEER
ncbi:hypothetical protein [Halorientalis salina]|uniref:hypothetical protein n=1 Tax=Halorientalis salina TaxID=2932266 RepID=UPI0010AB9BD2|nr:hypothetical protein [Halorientalis salina]